MKPNISNALKLLVSYFCILILGTFLCAILYTIYILCTNLVAGQTLSIFDLSLFVKGAIIFAPVVMSLSGMFMIFYLIRHSSASWLHLTLYCLLYASSWIILMPLCFSLENRVLKAQIEDEIFINEEKPIVSPDYFRKNLNCVYLYSDVTDENLVSGMCIEISRGEGEVHTFKNMAVLPTNEIFVDSIIQETMGLPRLVSDVLRYGDSILAISREAALRGFLNWLCFASMGLALMAVAGSRHLSSWRIVNVIVILFLTFGILTFNVINYEQSFITPIQLYFNSYLEKFIKIGNPFLMVCNFLLAIILFVIGLVIDIKRKKEIKGQAK